MLELKSFIEKNKIIILAASVFILSILFFLFPIIITFDGSHYLHYVSIFNGTLPFSSWDAVRGPVFPFLLYLSSGLFGQSSQGALVFQFLVYLIYAVVCYLLTRELFVKNTIKYP